MDIKDLAGEHVLDFVPRLDVRHPFDADANGLLFGLDGRCYLVFEDPSDGYRSSAGPLIAFEGDAYALGCRYPDYIQEKVICSHETRGEYGGEDDVLAIRSAETGAMLLRVGTISVDDYYPSFVVEWHPEGLSANSKERIA